jgi:hypothetical protein
MLDRMKSFIFLLNYPKTPAIQQVKPAAPFTHAFIDIADFWAA